jgi:hypothetical protein
VDAVGIVAVFLLTRTTFGRTGLCDRQPGARGLSVRRRTRLVVMAAFAIAGGLSAFGGVLLAGYASKAAQAMGDPYLLPAIAAVVLGGTSILGGRGSYLGTVAGVILITLLQSILSVMQMEEFGRHVTYGIVILAMLLIYGRVGRTRHKPYPTLFLIGGRNDGPRAHAQLRSRGPALSPARASLYSCREALHRLPWAEGTGVVRGRALSRLVRHPERPHAPLGRNGWLGVRVSGNPSMNSNGNTVDSRDVSSRVNTGAAACRARSSTASARCWRIVTTASASIRRTTS